MRKLDETSRGILLLVTLILLVIDAFLYFDQSIHRIVIAWPRIIWGGIIQAVAVAFCAAYLSERQKNPDWYGRVKFSIIKMALCVVTAWIGSDLIDKGLNHGNEPLKYRG